MIKINISSGELIDRITILELKSRYTSEVQRELQELIELAKSHNLYKQEFLDSLLEINKKLWDVEDELRILEKQQDFSEKFIILARQVYLLNDERARLKREINQKTNSDYTEIKLY